VKKDTATLALRVIDLLIAGVTLIPQIKRRAQRARSKIQVMIDEGRDPTDAEWDEILGDGEALSEDIRKAVEAKRNDPRWQPPED